MQEENNPIQNVPASSPDFHTELAEKLSELLPEVIADGKVDVTKLKELLDGDTDDAAERFGLFWPGKKRAMRAAQEPTTATLKPSPDESKDWDTTKNIFIEGDNLEVLKILGRQYHGKIKMIYIDPPYNTGKDFVYPDNYKEGLQNYLEFTKQVDEGGKRVSTNSDTEGRYHSNWLSMMYPRLKLARNLLTDDGVIFISIDEHEQDNLKKICHEIFGETNFIACIANVNNPKGRSDDKYFATSHEYILVYARNAGRLELYGWEPGNEIVKRYNKVDGNGVKYREIDLRKTGDNDRRQDRPNLFYYFYFNEKTGELLVSKDDAEKDGYIKITPIREDGSDGNWRWELATSLQNLDNLIPKFMPVRQRYSVFVKDLFDPSERIKPVTAWTFKDVNSERGSEQFVDLGFEKTIFPRPKPLGVIIRMLQLGLKPKKNDIVLDFFAGSGTIAHAVMLLNAEDGGNRSCIQVQLPEPTDEKSDAHKAGFGTIAQIARERINRAGKKIQQDFAERIAERDAPLDVGYRTYKLADTNFTKWQDVATDDVGEFQQRLLDMRESANGSASELDILTEVMLKLGLELTVDTKQENISGLAVWSIANGNILVYLKEREKPTLDQLRALAETQPVKIVVLDDAFIGDDELKTNLTQICKTNRVELWTV